MTKEKPLYWEETELRKESDRLIKLERKRIAAEADRFGQQLLDARRALGVADPVGESWGDRMVQFQIGLRALALGMQEQNFSIDKTPEALRKWLSNPIEDHPATDGEIAMYIELIAEREKLVNAA